MSSAYQKISNRFQTKERKQLTFNIDTNTLLKMDKISDILYDLNKQPYTRNALIEDAINSYIDEIENYLQKEYHTSINDYCVQEKEKKSIKKEEIDFDLVVYPGHEDGFYDEFKKKSRWYPVRIQKENIKKVKYIAIYISKPVSAITYYARVLDYVPCKDNPNKYVVLLDKKEKIELDNPIILGNLNAAATRSPKYTTLEKLKKAKTFGDL